MEPLGLPFGSLLAPKMAETCLDFFFWSAREPFKSFFFSAPEASRSAPGDSQEPSKSCSRGLQELKRPQEGSKRPLGTDFDLSRPPRDPQINDFSGPQGNSLVPRACQEHSAKHPRSFRNILKQACFLESIPKFSETSRPGPPT